MSMSVEQFRLLVASLTMPRPEEIARLTPAQQTAIRHAFALRRLAGEFYRNYTEWTADEWNAVHAARVAVARATVAGVYSTVGEEPEHVYRAARFLWDRGLPLRRACACENFLLDEGETVTGPHSDGRLGDVTHTHDACGGQP